MILDRPDWIHNILDDFGIETFGRDVDIFYEMEINDDDVFNLPGYPYNGVMWQEANDGFYDNVISYLNENGFSYGQPATTNQVINTAKNLYSKIID